MISSPHFGGKFRRAQTFSGILAAVDGYNMYSDADPLSICKLFLIL